MNIQEQQNILKLSNVKTVIEYSRIGKSVCTNENFSRLVNVIKNIRYAAKVEILEENLVHIHFTTINRGKEVHRIVYIISTNDLTEDQLKHVVTRSCNC